MAFKVKDVLIIDATVIVGLLILLSFQSISSSFIETESSDFMREWYTVQNQYSSTLELLEDCKMLNDDQAAYETHVLKGDSLSSEMEDEIKKSCSKWLVESLEQERYLMKLNHWGYNFNYLQQRDGDGIIYTAGTQVDPFYDIQGGTADYYDTKLSIRSEGPEKIAMWLLDTDYDGRSVYPQQVFFPMNGKSGGWNKLAKTLQAYIDEDLITKYQGTESIPFEAGPNKRIAVKIIDDRGIESLKIIDIK